jgi:hypothetical protein
VQLLAKGSRTLQTALAEAAASLPAADLWPCFQAARRALPAGKVLALFSPFLTAKVDEKKKQRDQNWLKREAIIGGLGFWSTYYCYRHMGPESWSDDPPPLDPSWLDVAVQMKHLGLIRLLIRPDHAAANTFLKKTFSETFAKAKQLQDCQEVVDCMIHAQHLEATDAAVAVIEKFGKKTDYYGFFVNLLADLPKSALPRLEALVPHVSDRMSDTLLGAIQQLRAKP